MDGFFYRRSQLQDDALRQLLIGAILDDDAVRFRAVLGQHAPNLLDGLRLFGVLIMSPEGAVPLLRDQNGEPLSPDYVIQAGTPIDLLNVDYTDEWMIVTWDGQQWRAPLPGRAGDE